jgi:hypothetical protein
MWATAPPWDDRGVDSTRRALRERAHGPPLPVGGAAIHRLDDDGSRTVYSGGFTAIGDLAFARNGPLYVQFASGQVLRVDA